MEPQPYATKSNRPCQEWVTSCGVVGQTGPRETSKHPRLLLNLLLLSRTWSDAVADVNTDVLKHRDIALVPSWKLHSYRPEVTVLEGTLHTTGEGYSSTQPSHKP